MSSEQDDDSDGVSNFLDDDDGDGIPNWKDPDSRWCTYDCDKPKEDKNSCP